MSRLMNYATGEDLREATDKERYDSVEAAKTDGGAGVITVKIVDDYVRCYVQD